MLMRPLLEDFRSKRLMGQRGCDLEFTTNSPDGMIGLTTTLPSAREAPGNTGYGVGYYSLNGYYYANSAYQGSAAGSFKDVAFVMMAWDGSRIWFGRNGAWHNGDPEKGTGGYPYAPGGTAYPVYGTYWGGTFGKLTTDPSKFAQKLPAGFGAWEQ